MKKKDKGWTTTLATIFVLVILLGVAIASRHILKHEPEKSECGCIIHPGATGPLVYAMKQPERFMNPAEGNATINGGGWWTIVYTVCNEVPLDKVKVTVWDAFVPHTSVIPALGGMTAKYHPKNGTEDWYIYGNGVAYYSDHGMKKRLDPINPVALSQEQLRTLENVTLVFMDRWTPGKLSSGDEFLIFRDIDADHALEFEGAPGYSQMSMDWYGRGCVSMRLN